MNMEKNEWQYLAAMLIFGPQKIRSKELSVYSLDIFRTNKELNVAPVSFIDTDTRKLETKRYLKIRPHISFIATHVQSGSDVAKILGYENTEKNVHISDAIFSEREFELTGYNWDRLVDSRIYKLSVLIKSTLDRKIDDVPLLINEFPCISGLFLKDESYWS
jgi:hypothetical protein